MAVRKEGGVRFKELKNKRPFGLRREEQACKKL